MAVLKRQTRPDGSTTGIWTDAPTEITRKCVFMDIIGTEGSGKTTLALTAPGPIAFMHADEKIEGVVQPAARDKKVRVLNFGGTFTGSVEEISRKADAKWRLLQQGWFDAVGNWAKSSILDTGTEGWELLRLARFGQLNPKGRTEALYGPVNAEWRSMFKHFRAQEATNIITIHQVKDKYVDKMVNGKIQSMNTGDKIRAGMKEMGYMADIVVRTFRDNGEFKGIIEKGWYNASVEGIELDGAQLTFPAIMALITETDEDDWR